MLTLESTHMNKAVLISKKMLLLPYLVVPFVIVLISLDYLFFNQRLQSLLLVQPVLVFFA
jgi:hypothetical protein